MLAPARALLNFLKEMREALALIPQLSYPRPGAVFKQTTAVRRLPAAATCLAWHAVCWGQRALLCRASCAAATRVGISARCPRFSLDLILASPRIASQARPPSSSPPYIQVMLATAFFLLYVAFLDWMFGHIPKAIAWTHAHPGWLRRLLDAGSAAAKKAALSAWQAAAGVGG